MAFGFKKISALFHAAKNLVRRPVFAVAALAQAALPIAAPYTALAAPSPAGTASGKTGTSPYLHYDIKSFFESREVQTAQRDAFGIDGSVKSMQAFLTEKGFTVPPSGVVNSAFYEALRSYLKSLHLDPGPAGDNAALAKAYIRVLHLKPILQDMPKDILFFDIQNGIAFLNGVKVAEGFKPINPNASTQCLTGTFTMTGAGGHNTGIVGNTSLPYARAGNSIGCDPAGYITEGEGEPAYVFSNGLNWKAQADWLLQHANYISAEHCKVFTGTALGIGLGINIPAGPEGPHTGFMDDFFPRHGYYLARGGAAGNFYAVWHLPRQGNFNGHWETVFPNENTRVTMYVSDFLQRPTDHAPSFPNKQYQDAVASGQEPLYKWQPYMGPQLPGTIVTYLAEMHIRTLQVSMGLPVLSISAVPYKAGEVEPALPFAARIATVQGRAQLAEELHARIFPLSNLEPSVHEAALPFLTAVRTILDDMAERHRAAVALQAQLDALDKGRTDPMSTPMFAVLILGLLVAGRMLSRGLQRVAEPAVANLLALPVPQQAVAATPKTAFAGPLALPAPVAASASAAPKKRAPAAKTPDEIARKIIKARKDLAKAAGGDWKTILDKKKKLAGMQKDSKEYQELRKEIAKLAGKNASKTVLEKKKELTAMRNDPNCDEEKYKGLRKETATLSAQSKKIKDCQKELFSALDEAQQAKRDTDTGSKLWTMSRQKTIRIKFKKAKAAAEARAAKPARNDNTIIYVPGDRPERAIVAQLHLLKAA